MAERICIPYRDALVALYFKLNNPLIADVPSNKY